MKTVNGADQSGVLPQKGVCRLFFWHFFSLNKWTYKNSSQFLWTIRKQRKKVVQKDVYKRSILVQIPAGDF